MLESGSSGSVGGEGGNLLAYPAPQPDGTARPRSVSPLQEAAAGVGEDPRAGDDVGIAGIFGPVVADAADRGHEQHAGGHDRGRIWASWPAPDGIRSERPPAQAAAAASTAS